MRRIHIKMANTNNATTTIELKHVQAQKIRQKITRGKKIVIYFFFVGRYIFIFHDCESKIR